MRILQVNPYPPENLGGSEIFCKNLAINLKLGKNVDSHILTSDIFNRKVKTEIINEDIKVIYKKCYFNLWNKNPVSNILSYLKNNYQNYDIIHTHSYIFFTSLQCAFLKKFKDFPLITHIHGGVQTPSSLASNYMEKIQISFKNNIFDKIIGNFTIKNSDRIISVSKKDLQFISNRYKIDKNKAFYIPNGIDVNRFKKSNKSEKEYITFIGRLSYIKGIDIFIDIINQIYKNNKNAKFLIIGRGPLYKLVKQAQKTIPIKYISSYPYEKINEIYNISKVIMITSRFEGLPTILLESLACETPVIASDVGGISEVIESNQNGFLFKIETIEKQIKNILEIINNENTLTKFGKNGREKMLKDFSWKSVVDKVFEIYETLI